MKKGSLSELVTYLDELIRMTNDSEMDWVKVNPTTYTWEAGSPPTARISLQQVERRVINRAAGRSVPEMRRDYVFAVTDLGTGSLQLQVSSADEPDIRDKLKLLYVAASTGIPKKGLDFLKSLLPRKPQ